MIVILIDQMPTRDEIRELLKKKNPDYYYEDIEKGILTDEGICIKTSTACAKIYFNIEKKRIVIKGIALDYFHQLLYFIPYFKQHDSFMDFENELGEYLVEELNQAVMVPLEKNAII